MPRVIIIAGPNGAGKTTFAREFLPNEAATLQFVNADLIAAGLSPFDPDSANVEAGRLMIERLGQLAGRGEDFALETTLSGKWLVRHVRDWQARGYVVKLHYIRLPSVEVSIQRVQNRVAHGGHGIPEDVLRRRFNRSLELFESTYKNLVDDWFVYHNYGTHAVLIDEGGKSK
jgi:predicted ABC-type ATPase